MELPIATNTNESQVKKTSLRKTGRKNKLGITIKYPKNAFFTNEDIFELYPDGVEITLRNKIRTAHEKEKILTKIGTINTGSGRPRNVFCLGSPSKELLEKAKEAEVMFEVGIGTSSVPANVSNFGLTAEKNKSNPVLA
jgi:hypothetical protein